MLQAYKNYIRSYKKNYPKAYPYKWQDLELQDLLSLSFKDLKLSLSNSFLIQKAIYGVLKEWRALGYRWQPYFWYSTEWFYPEGTYGVAIPFYLAHPKLMATEKYLIGSIEGKNLEDLKKYLRHELGHILDYSYRWRFNMERRNIFGLSSLRYPNVYHVKPTSKKYVKNLPAHYAQSHPDEDFAETFAVYMKYQKSWKSRFPSGLINKKLALIESLVKTSKKTKPKHLEKFKPGDIRDYKISLEKFYAKKSYDLGMSHKEFYDKLSGKRPLNPNKDLRDFVKPLVEKLKIPKAYKSYLLHKYYSPLLHHKKVLSLWKNNNKQELKEFIKNKSIHWLKKGPFYYT